MNLVVNHFLIAQEKSASVYLKSPMIVSTEESHVMERCTCRWLFSVVLGLPGPALSLGHNVGKAPLHVARRLSGHLPDICVEFLSGRL